MAPTVYLCHRRDVSRLFALSLFHALHDAGADVLLDPDELLTSAVEQQIRAREYLIVLAGPATLANKPADERIAQEIRIGADAGRKIVLVLMYAAELDEHAKLNALRGLKNTRITAAPVNEPVSRFATRLMQALTRASSPDVPPAPEDPAVQRKLNRALRLPVSTDDQLEAEYLLNLALCQEDDVSTIPVLSEAIRLHPDYAEAYFQRGVLHVRRKNYLAALPDFDAALRLRPLDPVAYNNRGLVKRTLNDVAGAIADFDEAIRLNSHFASAYNNRGLARRASNDIDGAIEDFTEALIIRRDYATAYTNRGHAQKIKATQQADNPAAARAILMAALEDYDAALACQPRYAPAYNNRASLKYLLRDYDGAIADYTSALVIDPTYATAYFNRGIAYKTRGDAHSSQLAVADFDAAARLQPRAEVFYHRGQARKVTGDLSGALKDYEEALKLNPNASNALTQRGAAKRLTGDLSGALADHEAALQQGDNAQAYYNRAAARAESGDIPGALSDYDQALRINPRFAEAYNRRGILRYSHGDMNGALADYGFAIAINPRLAAAYNNRGTARYAQNDIEGALADYSRAILLDENYALAYVNRGAVYADTGDFGAALRDYDVAIALNPQHASAYYNRGVAHLSLDQLDEAIEDYDRALMLNPMLHEARLNRGLARASRGMPEDTPLAMSDLRGYLPYAEPQRQQEVSEILAALEKQLRK